MVIKMIRELNNVLL